ncbi:MAG: lysylphosphatidylglycerol synthase transmembrane domain-containing protein [Lautropia sp.]
MSDDASRSGSAEAVAGPPRRWRFVRPLLGAMLLLGIAATLEPAQLRALARDAHWPWFALAVLLTLANQCTSALRWRRILLALGVPITRGRALVLSFQALAGNAVLPGGLVAGDAWRVAGAVSATPAGVDRRASRAAASVALDRIGGLWALAMLSLAACVVVGIDGVAAPAGGGAYATTLAVVALLPLASRLVPGAAAADGAVGGGRVARIARTVSRGLGVMIRTLPMSLLVQASACGAMVAACRTVGAVLDGWLIVAACATVFVAAALPAAIGGFGARELAAVAVFVPLGMSHETAFAGSVLFGLTNTAMGVIGALVWLSARR